MQLVVTILIGTAVGVLVELLLPGHTPAELVLALLLGVAGALLAQLVGEAAGWFEAQEPGSFLAAALGSVLVLLCYGVLFRRQGRRG